MNATDERQDSFVFEVWISLLGCCSLLFRKNGQILQEQKYPSSISNRCLRISGCKAY
jgi:hypothetical protein